MPAHIEYHLLESGIHKYTWLDNSRDAIEDCVTLYKKMNASASSGDTVFILIDLRQSGALPIHLLTQRVRESGIRDDVTYRTAYISDEQIVQILMKNFAVINRVGGNRAFFGSREEDKAIEWLLNAHPSSD